MTEVGLVSNMLYNIHMSFIKRVWHKITLMSFAFLTPLFALYAEDNCDTASGKICSPINVSTINEFIRVFLEGVLKVGIPIVALAVVYCGFLFVKARGKPEEITKAKDALLYTLIGAAILLGSWAIAQLISNTVLAL